MRNFINKIRKTLKGKAPDAQNENNSFNFWSDKRGITAIEVALYILVSVVLVSALLGLVVPGLNTIWTSVMAKITETIS